MDPVRFFYSTDGTDVRGPVTRDALRLLIQNNVIGSAAFVCREGENEWRPLHPDEFQSGAGTRLKPYEPPPYVPTLEALERMKGPPQETWEDSESGPPFLKAAVWVAMFGGPAAVYVVNHTLHPSSSNSAMDVFKEIIHAAYAYLTVIVIVPYLISLLFKNITRHVVRLVGMLIITCLLISRLFYTMATPPFQTDAVAQDKTKQVATEGNSVADSSPTSSAPSSATPPPTPAAQNSLAEQARHDLTTVTSQFIAIIKASNEAEVACNVDVNTIESTDDLARRRAALMKLRAAQLEVIVYLQNFDSHCREALSSDNFPADFVSNLLDLERKNGKIDLLIILWQSKMKLTDDHIARLDYLAKSYGAWNVKDGKVVFTDTDALTAFEKLQQALQKDVDNIGDEQKKITQ